MKFSLFNNFGARNSVPVFGAFANGLSKLNLPYTYHDMSADVAVIWSVVWGDRMRDNKIVWDHFRGQGKPVIVLEVGMLHRDQTWKLGLNGTGLESYPSADFDFNRPYHLGLTLQPWKDSGKDIVIVMQRTDSQQWANQPSADIWLQHIVNRLQQITDRPIVIRPHPRQKVVTPHGCILDQPQRLSQTYDGYNFNNTLQRAWAIINWNSGPGSQSIMAGVPAFVGSSSLAAPVGNLDWSQIENPNRPDRNDWLVRVSHTEWTVDEIASGYPLSRLLPSLT